MEKLSVNIGLYIHIPFCKQKCLYCDFPSYSGFSYLYSAYTAALCREISGWGGILTDAVIDTVYIGGGTPTILPQVLLKEIIECVREHFVLAKDGEYSIEANPGTVGGEMLQTLGASGINRISFGVQSFSDELLKGLGRIHSAEDTLQAVALSRRAGFENISVDLMYGLPGQSLADVKESVEAAMRLDVRHISAYGLKVEENTPFFARQEAGILNLPAEETEEEMYDYITGYLPEQGYCRYEISNYAQEGWECRHNLKYWRFQPYLGVGAAAHSFLNRDRFANDSDVIRYMRCIEQNGSPISEKETLNEGTAMAEFVFLSLRTAAGMEIQGFDRYFSRNFFSKYGKVVENLEKEGLLRVTQERICLTSRGMKFGNRVFAAFLD
jgi:oxygen-independent coproporphyrinogen-3 oxidase